MKLKRERESLSLARSHKTVASFSLSFSFFRHQWRALLVLETRSRAQPGTPSREQRQAPLSLSPLSLGKAEVAREEEQSNDFRRRRMPSATRKATVSAPLVADPPRRLALHGARSLLHQQQGARLHRSGQARGQARRRRGPAGGRRRRPFRRRHCRSIVVGLVFFPAQNRRLQPRADQLCGLGRQGSP